MRIRTVKPEFFQDEKLALLSRDARLLYIALWTEADDQGRLRGNPKYLHGRLFPYDPGDWFEAGLKELVDNQRVIVYEHEGCAYLFLPKFLKHQYIDRPSRSCLPVPPCTLAEPSPNVPRAHAEPSAPDLGIKGSRDRGIKGGVEGEAEPSAPSPQSSLPGLEEEGRPAEPQEKKNGTAVQSVFDHWRTVMGHQHSKLDERRRRRIEWAVKTYGEQVAKKAIDGCRSSDFHMGQNQDRKRYDDLTLIFRDAEHFERFAGITAGPAQEPVEEKRMF